MFGNLARKFLGSANERYIGRVQPLIDRINGLEPEMQALSDAELAARTGWLKQRYENGEALDDLLVDAFATVREAAWRTLGERHFDVQLIGGTILHRGMIAEMKTGEGKTLVATLPVYLNALEGKGVHVVTVNDYLAQRDAEWMGQVYKFLGLTVGCITNELNDDERREAYGCDVTYGTNNEYGFDYLRDNMKFDLEEMVQRPFNFAIVDEVDSILIDEARTPLIISGPTDDTSELYIAVDKVIPGLVPDDYEIDEKQKTVALTDAGNEHLEALLAEAGLLGGHDLYEMQNVSVVHHANQALRAHKLFRRDTDYIVKNNQVIIIDEFTGRMMEGRRYSEGLHQALEAKEGVEIQTENQTVASITFQNYFRMYPKLAGMTGTAMTEAAEFIDIYKLEVVDVPTNVAVERVDEDDEVYRTGEERDAAVLDLIEDCSKRGQPTLVGTVSIEKSELLAEKLGTKSIPHQVLNARHHEREAFIIAQGGEPGAVTIATNMAGRGTDIRLGGNADMRIVQELGDLPEGPERDAKEAEIRADVEEKKKKVVAAGGLFVIATERHESRRIDNQLRGRSGRQGDPGNSRFFLSLQDDLMRIFGSERMDGWLQRLGLKEGEAVVHGWINKAVERAQRKVEERNYEIRKNLLKFDDVMNDQRKVIYAQRIGIMKTDDVSETIRGYREEAIEAIVEDAIPEGAYAEQWDIDSLYNRTLGVFGLDLPVRDWAAEEGIADQEIYERILEAVNRRMAEKTASYSPELMRLAEKSVLLQILDQQWKEHLLQLDHLRQAVNLRAYGQKDPLIEYKREAFDMFQVMLSGLKETTVGALSHLEIELDADPESLLPQDGSAEWEQSGPGMGDDLAPFGLPPLGSLEDMARMAGMDLDALEPEPEYATNGNGGVIAPVRTRKAASNVDPGNPATWGKVSRNAACPCGSGKKYKHCHGRA
ncbi:MAG: preprotein translocase subunit SecA [Rhodospirillaceae bacterium]|nr:preprotein translocase subunit SecA [Rhodospirillaceae bacterium]